MILAWSIHLHAHLVDTFTRFVTPRRKTLRKHEFLLHFLVSDPGRVFYEMRRVWNLLIEKIPSNPMLWEPKRACKYPLTHKTQCCRSQSERVNTCRHIKSKNIAIIHETSHNFSIIHGSKKSVSFSKPFFSVSVFGPYTTCKTQI